MPCRRHSSPVSTPASDSFRMAMIWSSLNRLFLTTPPLALAGHRKWKKSHFQWTIFRGAGHLTVGVQLADLCAYALRRYCENGETDLFDRIWTRFHRVAGHVVGIRHYARGKNCTCRICAEH